MRVNLDKTLYCEMRYQTETLESNVFAEYIEYNKRLDHRRPSFEALLAEGREAAGINFYLQDLYYGNQRNEDYKMKPAITVPYITMQVCSASDLSKSCVGDGLF